MNFECCLKSRCSYGRKEVAEKPLNVVSKTPKTIIAVGFDRRTREFINLSFSYEIESMVEDRKRSKYRNRKLQESSDTRRMIKTKMIDYIFILDVTFWIRTFVGDKSGVV